MINPIAFIGEPLNFGKLCKIYPPTIKEVLTMPRFGQYKKLLTITQDELELELKDKIEKDQQIPTPLEFALANAYHSAEFYQIVTEAYSYFTREPVVLIIEQKKIVFDTEEGAKEKIQKDLPLRALTEEDYFDFQNMIRISCGEQPIKKPEPIDPNEDPRIRRIKEKARLRDAIKAKKGVAGNGITFETCLVAICYMGLGINPLNIGEMSYAAIGPIMKMYQEKEKYDLDVKTLLAGGDSKKIKPKYWIRNTD